MIRGSSALLGTAALPLPRPFLSGPRRSGRVTRGIKCQKGNDEGRHGQRWEAFLAAALIATSLGASATGDVMPKAHAEQSVVEKRRAEANKRKELLSRARADVLNKGGVDGVNLEAVDSEPAEAPPVAAAVKEADKVVEEGNQARSAMSSSMLDRLKKASADYEKQAGAGPQKPKDAPNPELPLWLKEKIQGSKAEQEQKEAPASAPQKPSGGFSLPGFASKVTEQKPEAAPAQPLKYNSPAPAPAPAPSIPEKRAESPTPPLAKVDPTPPQPLKSVIPPPSPSPAPAPAPQAAPASASKEQGADFGSYFKAALDSPAPKEAPKPKPPQTIIKAPLLDRNEPRPQPAPAKLAAPAPVKENFDKRKGPLPLWLAEIFVILGIVGTLFATAKWSNELDKLWRKAAAQLEALYNKIDKRQTSGQ